MPGSLLHFESVGSLLNVPTITPTALSRPAGFRVADTELDGKLTISVGFHPISATLRIACAENFGVPATRSASAPELFKVTTCESTVGSVISYAVFCMKKKKKKKRKEKKEKKKKKK